MYDERGWQLHLRTRCRKRAGDFGVNRLEERSSAARAVGVVAAAAAAAAAAADMAVAYICF
jgi:hypothetical protein